MSAPKRIYKVVYGLSAEMPQDTTLILAQSMKAATVSAGIKAAAMDYDIISITLIGELECQ